MEAIMSEIKGTSFSVLRHPLEQLFLYKRIQFGPIWGRGRWPCSRIYIDIYYQTSVLNI